MILHFRHKGLKRLYEKGDPRRVAPDQLARIERVLARLDVAHEPSHMDLPGLRLHPLKGNLTGYWAVDISGNWRLTFRFDGGHVVDVDLVDYH